MNVARVLAVEDPLDHDAILLSYHGSYLGVSLRERFLVHHTRILQIDAKFSTPSVSPAVYPKTKIPSTQTTALGAPFPKL